MQILVLESSTSSAKAMLYNDIKGISETITEQYDPQCGDIRIQDPERVFLRTIEAGKKIIGNKDIDMIAISGTWHSIFACDKDFKPVTKSYTWAHTEASYIAQELRKDIDFTKRFYNTTGCMVNAIYPVFKLMNLQNQGLNLTDYIFMGQGTYNYHRLTGEFLLSESMASGSGLLDIHTKELSQEVLELLGIRKKQLGRITSYRELRPLSKEGANLLGIKSGIPVITAHPDGALNQIGAGALNDGVMTLSIGTSAALRISTSKPIIPVTPSTWCYLSPVSWLSGAATSGACNCVDWIKNKFFSSSTTYKEIEEQKIDMKSIPIFLPFLYGERCPGWNDARKASFYDVNSEHSNLELYFSTLEGVIFNLYQCYEVLCKTDIEPDKIKLSGGILNSKIWTQMCCDILGREMECSKEKQMSLMGGVALALELGGALKNLDQFNGKDSVVIYPNRERYKGYKKRYERYKEIYNYNL